jgi:hypothetical protein
VQSGCAIDLRKIDVGTRANELCERGGVAAHDRIGHGTIGGLQLDDGAQGN